MQACVIPSVRVRQSPTVKGRSIQLCSTQLRAKKSKPAKSLRARYNSGGASEPHLDFPIGSKTKGALQGPAFVRRTPVRAHISALHNYSPSVGTYFGGLGLKEGCFSLCFLLLLQYKDLYQVCILTWKFFFSHLLSIVDV